MEAKTNALRMLDAQKTQYTAYTYGDGKTALPGTAVAQMIGIDEGRVFKTLVTVGASRAHYVFMIPVAEELDLKKAAASVKEKSLAMLPQKELLPLTGYVHGDCSPIGMKKRFITVAHITALDYDKIVFSGGRIGIQIEMPYKALEKLIESRVGDIVRR